MSSNDKDSIESLWASSYLDGNNALYLEQLYEQYCEDPASVDEKWQNYFGKIAAESPEQPNHSDIREYFKNLSSSSLSTQIAASPAALVHAQRQAQVFNLINAYRNYGNGKATLDPLGLTVPAKLTRLSLEHHILAGCEDEVFDSGDFYGLEGNHKLKDIVAALQATYCGNITAEFMHLSDHDELVWLEKNFEGNLAKAKLSAEDKKIILQKLTNADGLEKFLGRKYVGQKRFALEGGDSLIPLLNEIAHRSALKHGVKEIIMGMAHRGRLNVLVNILGKLPKDLFEEFEGKHGDDGYMGDVKYHMGFSSNLNFDGGLLHMSLAFNPSHLEIVDPVVEGATRAKQRRYKDSAREKVVPVLIHGDSAFAGQGVVMETFAMSQCRGFTTGGSVHIVINNQVGFTTNKREDVRSSLYCTDIAKMVQAPVIHVNGDDPEAVIMAGQIAIDYRAKFNKDVVIDCVCYRRHGHNESDEPSATQPLMYKEVKKHQTPWKLYADKLVVQGVIQEGEAEQYFKDYQKALDGGESVADATDDLTGYEHAVNWAPYINQTWRAKGDTSVELNKLKALANKLYDFPEGLTLQAQVNKVMNDRKKMIEGDLKVDWGFAENLAYATLATSGYQIRMSGQDSGRGTFAHRHAVLHDQVTGESYMPLQHLSVDQANVGIIDSLLSEEAVLAFEYGYATAEPTNLVIWEAQFGDFVNGAQVVIDQFIASGEQKWKRMCGLVMLLPHGYEGMGAEHSSARLERFLQLCAQDNMQVCVPTTPAQIFHLLRRQMVRPLRTPLIVMSPKSLLRHKLATSSIEELSDGSFQLVIPDADVVETNKVERVILCSGKVYYDLLQKRTEADVKNAALVRVEQLYPFPKEEIRKEVAKYKNAKEVIWCQEEPKNQGPWFSMGPRLEMCLERIVKYIGRPAAAAPAVGVAKLHAKEQATLVNEALMIKKEG